MVDNTSSYINKDHQRYKHQVERGRKYVFGFTYKRIKRKQCLSIFPNIAIVA